MYANLPQVEYDEDGFVTSFSVEEAQAIKEYYHKFGFVVIRDAVSSTQADAAYSSLWDYIEEDGKSAYERAFEISAVRPVESQIPQPVSRNDIDSWKSSWPYTSGGAGILGAMPLSSPSWENRQSKELYEAFSIVLGTKDLLVSIDRFGFMRPTYQIPFSTGKEDKPEWSTKEKWVHWDLNPWYWTKTEILPANAKVDQKILECWKEGYTELFVTENNDVVDFKGYDKVQGLVALLDSQIDDGGFCCVPGFQHVIKEWSENTKMFSRGHFVHVPKDDKLIDHLQRIPMRKGSAVIWSSCLPHCNYPNHSGNPRACQYIKMFPSAVVFDELKPIRSKLVKSLLPKDFTPSAVGKQVFGIDNQ